MRKTVEETEKTRRLLVECATRRFILEGFSATKLEDIAADAGLTRGAFYWHFKNKQAIFRAIIEENSKEALKLVARYLENDHDPAERIKDFVRHLLGDRHRKNHQVFVLIRLKQQPPSGLANMDDQIPSVEEIVVPALEDTIKEGKQMGIFGAALDAAFSAKCIYTFFWGFFVNYDSLYKDYTDEQLIQQINGFLSQLLGIKTTW
ncbi:TetR/AcrR family transcriptional regulator [Muricauda sp. SCSIO 64092]|uniref:TetR/AcrR family transcriptional regulator n=1 Tax=Allomuricauda sp. SCSIO 64092 TaxID=2908842 RepID=UPI001FF48BDE|nr:TetR family transcriptional regulator [Muricauda sp. SCSIO 64092]UOY08290.1 TetR/AcrR family transcriptional regulator [Muricauda sp. SCSIO 64092]